MSKPQITRDLPCKLSAEEAQEKSQELAKLTLEHAALLQEAKDAGATFRLKAKGLKKQIATLAEVVSSGVEDREVPIEISEALVNGAQEIRRLDTNEIIHVDALDDGAQQTLPVNKPKKPKKGAHARKGEDKPATFSTGEPAIGIGADDHEYELTAEQADVVRNGGTVEVQSMVQGRPVDILKLKKARKKTNATSEAEVMQ